MQLNVNGFWNNGCNGEARMPKDILVDRRPSSDSGGSSVFSLGKE